MAMLVACGLYVASMIRLATLVGSLHKRDCEIAKLLFPKHRIYDLCSSILPTFLTLTN